MQVESSAFSYCVSWFRWVSCGFSWVPGCLAWAVYPEIKKEHPVFVQPSDAPEVQSRSETVPLPIEKPPGGFAPACIDFPGMASATVESR